MDSLNKHKKVRSEEIEVDTYGEEQIWMNLGNRESLDESGE